MSLEYYLFCRQKYEEIMSYLDSILEAHDLINDFTTFKNNLELIPYPLLEHNHNQAYFFDIKKHMIKLRNLCTSNINKLCIHEFEQDTIDMLPDKCENIIYCKKCGCTKK